MTTPGNTLRCVLLGTDSLLIECGEILLRGGHTVVAVVAGSSKVASWAAERSIGVIDGTSGSDGNWIAKLAPLDFDWLFAITHLAIVPPEILALPKLGAINFHDGPLPSYSGLNAPAWALLDGTSDYGIVWHLMTGDVDAGDIVASRDFEIDTAETSLSINTRNFQLAIEAFEELVGKLAQGLVDRRPQDGMVERVVYRRADRPEAFAILNWKRPAQELERLVRALDFGPYSNPLARPAVRRDGVVLSVTRAEARDGGDAEPGVVMAIGGEEIVVACASGGSLALGGLTTLAGMPVDAAEAARQFGLVVGGKMDDLADGERAALTQLARRFGKHEAAQLARLSKLAPVEVPWARIAAGEGPHFPRLDVEVSPDLAKLFAERRQAALAAAFGAVLTRLSGKDRFHIAAADGTVAADIARAGPLVSPWAPFEMVLDMRGDFRAAVDAMATEIDRLARRGSFAADLIARDPELARRSDHRAVALTPIGIRFDARGEPALGVVAELFVSDSECFLRVDETAVERRDAALLVSCLEHAIAGLCAEPSAPVGQVDILGPALRHKVIYDWNAPATPVPGLCVHEAFERQADETPDAVAAIFEDRAVSYRDLEASANRLAAHLRSLGVGPDRLVGIHVERSIELLVSVLAVLKAGGAYVPLDPSYPAERLRHMITDSDCAVILTDSAVDSRRLADGGSVQFVRVDSDASSTAHFPIERVSSGADAANLAYCIYTSGSTGTPKGVLVEHRNVINFFHGMDDRIDRSGPASWFAVTSLSFDISVLELLYTTARGFTVVIYRDRAAGRSAQRASPVTQKGMDFSLFYFSGDAAEGTGSGKYRLLLDGARWADENGFCAVWTPERHFHAFGGLYPQPAVTAAAVAAITKKVSIRAGSVVVPLHHPIRIAEAWSIVDNISDGRVAISIASGWQPNDFVLMPENFAKSKDIMFRDAEIIQRLWRGEAVAFPGPLGKDVEVRTLPRPVQPQLPMWVTTAGNPETYQQAGRIGANVLTHLLGQSVEQLGPKIAAYRQARAEAGFDPDAGIVTLMLHSFVSDDEAKAREQVREPLKAYLGTLLALLKQYAWAFPAFQKPKSGDGAGGDEFANLSEEEREAILEFAYLRYYETSGLFGTPATAAAMVDSLKAIGVNEIACLVDFGIDTETVLANLPHLGELRRLSQPAAAATAAQPGAAEGDAADQSAAAQLRRHRVTHLQCTPSMARLFTLQDDTRAALAEVANLFIGGEAFPVSLGQELIALPGNRRVTNMYGPTETTVWSTMWTLQGAHDSIPIGQPIANTSVYVLDAWGQPVPPGVPGELWIGGRGVVRGYHARPELTAERFVPDPFQGGETRMYRTGDVAKWKELEDGGGVVEFLGRVDHQVKIRGYRIELGEIEARLGEHPAVRECVVVVRPDAAGDPQLVAFAAARAGNAIDPAAVKEHLRGRLPDPMVPAHVVALAALPRTPNGKLDRNALPALADVQARKPAARPAAAEGQLEQTVLGAWQATLGDESIGVNDNFFDVGGHSLLVVRLHRQLRDLLRPQQVALTDLYRFPTVRSFVGWLQSDVSSTGAQRGADRGARRRDSRQRRKTYA